MRSARPLAVTLSIAVRTPLRHASPLPDQLRPVVEVTDLTALALASVAQAVRDIEDPIDRPPAVPVLMSVDVDTRAKLPDLVVERPRPGHPAEIEPSGARRPNRPALGVHIEHQLRAGQEVAEGDDRRVVGTLDVGE